MSLGRLTADLRRIATSLLSHWLPTNSFVAPCAACTSTVMLGRLMTHPGSLDRADQGTRGGRSGQAMPAARKANPTANEATLAANATTMARRVEVAGRSAA